MITSKLKEYAELAAKIKALEAEMEELKEPALAELREITNDDTEQGVEVVGSGVIRLSTYTSWKFPSEILKFRETLKEQEAMAKANGSAQRDDRYIIKFYKQ